jgi:triosephosphate isomerase
MRIPLVAGNWKMHGTRAANEALVQDILQADEGEGGAEVILCPPSVYLWQVGRLLKGSSVRLGAQDACAEAIGAHTGEVSAAMLRDVGCSHAIVGHSERRAMYGDTDQLVARKFVAVQHEGLVPILCVGETLEEREQGRTAQVVLRQLEAVMSVTGAVGFLEAVLAYEPVWAIGTGHNATPEQAQDVHALLRARVTEKDARIGSCIRILYGGSVKAANAAELFAMPDVDGGLIGGAALNGAEFRRICEAARARVA